MFINYLKISLRNLIRQKSYSFINITGLAIGIAVCIIILLYVKAELSYDQFNDFADRIYRLEIQTLGENGEIITQGNTLAPSFTIFLEEYFPQFENITRLYNAQTKVTRGNISFNEERLFFAEDDIFQVFTLPFISGDSSTALKDPFTIVLSESTSHKYFGNDNPLGKEVEIFGENFKVTGIIKDMPAHSHVHFELLASYVSLRGYGGSYNIKDDYFLGKDNFTDNVTYTYAKLARSVDVKTIESRIPEFLDHYIPPVNFDGKMVAVSKLINIGFRNLLDIHIRTDGETDIEPTTNATYITFFTLIAIFILIIACVNFINLSTARGIKRAKEVGLRKVVGSARSSLIRQFLGESILISFIAVILAIVLIYIALPYFQSFTGTSVDFNPFSNFTVTLILLGVFIISGLIAGIYPAVYLSSFKPITILRGEITKGVKGAFFRKGLVIFQFAISAALIMSVAIIYMQMKFMRTIDLGFNKENVLLIPMDNNLETKWNDFKQTLLQNSDIISVTASKRAPSGFLYDAPGFTIELNGKIINSPFNMPHNRVWYDFFKTYQMKIIAGRDFSKEFPTDDSLAYILNETACRNLGIDNPNDVIGATFQAAGFKEGNVIGVVKDFNYETLRNEIKPIVTYISGYVNTIGIRIAPGNYQGTLKKVKNIFSQYSPGTEFEHQFLDDRLDALYKNESSMMELFIYFSFLAIIIACLGLFGLSAFTSEQKTKEVGIRKVLGASISNISILLTKQIAIWIVIANIIACPVAYYFLDHWLNNFAYRISLGILPFVLSTAIAFIIAILTVSYQTIKAALANPVESLKYE